MQVGDNLTVSVIQEDDPTSVILIDDRGNKYELKGKTEALTYDACRALIDTIECTGGLCLDHKGLTTCVGDEEWLDLADVYQKACKALGHHEVWLEEEEDDDEDDDGDR